MDNATRKKMSMFEGICSLYAFTDASFLAVHFLSLFVLPGNFAWPWWLALPAASFPVLFFTGLVALKNSKEIWYYIGSRQFGLSGTFILAGVVTYAFSLGTIDELIGTKLFAPPLPWLLLRVSVVALIMMVVAFVIHEPAPDLSWWVQGRRRGLS